MPRFAGEFGRTCSSFAPIIPLHGPHRQMLAARYWPNGGEIAADQYYKIPTIDSGDTLVVAGNRPTGWLPGQRIILLVHGLTGCYQSTYNIRLTRRFLRQGYGVFRVNLRGCGPGFGHARGIYHSGRSEDTREVLRWLAKSWPESPVTQIGFSLGGNITLKMAGEDGNRPTGNLDSVASVSAPIDLSLSSRKLRHSSRLINRYFVSELQKEVLRREEFFNLHPRTDLSSVRILADFDDAYTAPWGGFRDAEDYYQQSSAFPWMKHIGIPSLVLTADDDPCVDSSPYYQLEPGPNMDLVVTGTGGHVGFFGRSDEPRCYHWSDIILDRWLSRRSKH